MIPKYEAIAADIRRSIEDGALKPGDKLPTVVEFCELYSVSKITVKRAIEADPHRRGSCYQPARDRAPTLKTRRGFPTRRFSRARTTAPRAFRMSTAGRR